MPWEYISSLSRVGFSVKHLMISRTKGEFRGVQGQIDEGEGAQAGSLRRALLQAQVKAASVDTGDAKRDEFLRSAEFFHAEKYPELTFSGRIDESSKERVRVEGELRILDKSRPITLRGKVQSKQIEGRLIQLFELTGELNREDYGLVWGSAMDTGGVLVGKQVRIEIRAAAGWLASRDGQA